jgi:hypothetical protein
MEVEGVGVGVVYVDLMKICDYRVEGSTEVAGRVQRVWLKTAG